MSRRGLRRILAVGGLALAFHPGTRPRDLAVAAPPPHAPEVDSLVVAPTRFSPNGDGRRDSVRVSYRVVVRETVTVRVTTLDSSETVRVLARDVAQEPIRVYAFTWNGRRDSLNGDFVPDGDYVVHVTSRSASGPYENERRVRVDKRPPTATIDSLDPKIYSPRAPGNHPVPRVRVRVGDSELGDSLHVVIRVLGPSRAFRLRLQQAAQDLQGDGFYWAVCDSCVRDRAVPDGLHEVVCLTSDPAGNAGTSRVDSLDKNARGPRPAVVHPLAGTQAHVQRADSLTGTAYDRHGVEEVRLRIDGQPSFAVPGGVPAGDSVFVFHADISTLLAAEGRYRLLLRGVDPYAVTDSLRYFVIVDRTAPGRPRLDPRPGPVSKTQTLDVALAIDPADAPYEVIRAGGALPADTTRASSPGPTRLRVLLLPGANALAFSVRDSALNVSPPETLTVVWETGRGIAVPERFHAGNRIQVHTGDQPGNGVELRVFATDGSLVQEFSDPSSKRVYEFVWDLRNPDGRRVKNGAYLLQARLRNADGSEERWRELIAILE